MTPKQPPRKPKGYGTRGPHPLFPEEGAMIAVAVKLTPGQRDKLYRLGGGAWVRERLRRAKEPGEQE